jgi:hypothetical protein
MAQFNITCPAGHAIRGTRQRRHQVLRCGECGQPVFVLGRSPFADAETGPGTATASGRSSPWRRPVVAGTCTLLVVLAALAGLFAVLSHQSRSGEAFRTHLRQAHEALAGGRLRKSAEEFKAAHRLAQSHPEFLPSADLHELNQLCRETSLLADLLSESLEEILLRASRSQEEEWQAQFRQRYKGPEKTNAVVFDAEVRRDGAGRYHLDWHLQAGVEPARIEMDDLAVLRGLPLTEPRRLLFGARLASMAREQNGVWVVRFEPDSGVLITNRQAATACCPPPLDADLLGVLDRQRQWLQER